MISAEQANKIAKREGILSMAVNICLGIFKLCVAFVTGSLAVMADAFETLSDCFSSIVLLIGLKISKMPADDGHPYGHGRAEMIASIAIAILLAVVGFSFIKDGVLKIYSGDRVDYGFWAIFAMVVTIVFKEGLAQYALWAARKTKMTSLKADAFHHRSDTLSSAILLLGMLFAFVGAKFGIDLWWMDGALSCVVGILLLRLAKKVLFETGSRLLGGKIPADLERQILQICRRIYGEDLGFHQLHYHDYGTHIEITFHLRFPGDIKLVEAHMIADKIEDLIYDELGVDATIHLDVKKTH
ncbi:MAG: cation diffusion facilitator family transporter [Opitutales bacterium]|nr:cation diffusion facilitator family transporter [Opitutales bacterium]